jgi:hypothetical protein
MHIVRLYHEERRIKEKARIKDKVKCDHPEKQRDLAERTFYFAVLVMKRSRESIRER